MNNLEIALLCGSRNKYIIYNQLNNDVFIKSIQHNLSILEYIHLITGHLMSIIGNLK